MLFPNQLISFMNVFIVGILIYTTYSGYKQGFLLKAISCFSILVMFVIANFVSGLFADTLFVFPKSLAPFKDTVMEAIFYERLNQLSIFAIVFAVGVLIVFFLKPILSMIGKVPVISEFNEVLGILFGFLQGIIIVICVLTLFKTPVFINGSQVIEQTYLKNVDQMTNRFLITFHDDIKELEALQKIVTPSGELDSEEEILLEEWLKSQGISEEDIQEFLNKIGYKAG